MKQEALLEVDPAVRRAFDYYPTPAWMTRALMCRVSLFDVLEPCSGEDAIVNVIGREKVVLTNDFDPSRPAEWNFDATLNGSWNNFDVRQSFWCVTNPPFNLADRIVPLAVKHCPAVAMMLRLSWLEPTAARARFLKLHPPSRLIVLPRHDWRGTGSTDSVTSAWFVWDEGSGRRGIEIVTKDERDELIALFAPQADATGQP